MIVPSNDESVFTSIDDLSTLQKNAIIRPDNPPPGIAGFVFDIITEDGAELVSDITDHYVEDNSAVQDHIALKPEIITVRGLVGELKMTKAQTDAVSATVNTLPVNTPLTPQYDPIAANKNLEQAEAAALNENSQTINKTLAQYFDNRAATNGTTKQSQAFNYFYQLWLGRQRFTVDTPWGFFTDMAILNLRATQGEETKYVSDFVISFKKIRYAKPVQFKPGKIAGRAEQQSSTVQKNSALGTEDVSTTSNQSIARAMLSTAVNFFYGP
jgi:hypothetical protein